MRAVFDTNVFVSALISPGGLPAQVLKAFEERRFTLVSSEPLLGELAAVLGRAKFHRRGITPERTRVLLANLREAAELVIITGALQLCRDPRDDMVIEFHRAKTPCFSGGIQRDTCFSPEPSLAITQRCAIIQTCVRPSNVGSIPPPCKNGS